MNLIVFATVIYVLVAIAMIVLILMQRGAGAQAGSGFGAGASATVFGASGSANFLSKMTKWLAIVFFAMSLGMAWYASLHGGRLLPAESEDIGLMAGAVPETSAAVPTPVPTPAPAASGSAASVIVPEAALPPAASSTPVEAAPASVPDESPPQGEPGG